MPDATENWILETFPFVHLPGLDPCEPEDMMGRRLMILTIAIVPLAGCTIVGYSTESDPTFVKSVGNHTYYLSPHDSPTIYEKKLFSQLREVLVSKGFSLAANFEDRVVEIQWSSRGEIYTYQGSRQVQKTANHSGTINGKKYSGTSTYNQAIPTTETKFKRDIRIVFYRSLTDKTGAAKRDQVWVGSLYIDAGEFDINPKYYLSKILDGYEKPDQSSAGFWAEWVDNWKARQSPPAVKTP
ncbi:MAG: hypothetical protein V3S29_02535 [bacterium]